MQRVVIADPTLLQEFFAAEREGAVEKPDEQPFPLGHVSSLVKIIIISPCADVSKGPFRKINFGSCTRVSVLLAYNNLLPGQAGQAGVQRV